MQDDHKEPPNLRNAHRTRTRLRGFVLGALFGATVPSGLLWWHEAVHPGDSSLLTAILLTANLPGGYTIELVSRAWKIVMGTDIIKESVSRQTLQVALATLNAFWYGIGGIVVATTLRTRRRDRRLRRGLCPTCEYDLTANVSGVCPECSEKIRPDAVPPHEESPW